ncbi:unnamed protein product, partial [Mesorhabditis belari]|uniref:Uncharacterized protein n=1 Tax=Mesorhabditis belari TaxID=2138241 RepID=A0AAF3F8G2_9BILA
MDKWLIFLLSVLSIVCFGYENYEANPTKSSPFPQTPRPTQPNEMAKRRYSPSSRNPKNSTPTPRKTASTQLLAETELEEPTAQTLMKALMNKRGENILRPRRNASTSVDVTFKMELYQIIELNERQQYVKVSAWIIERWYDDFLYWNPDNFENITEVKIPWTQIWIPDTVLYNTVVMKDDDQRRLMYAKITTKYKEKRSYVEFLYPAIFTFSCKLYLQFFPYDVQTCHMIFGSWTSDNKDIDYHPHTMEVGTSNYLINEGWTLMGTQVERHEMKYVCCPNNYTLLDFTLYLKRRPLFYLVNLVIPTFIITLIAITGFFTTSSTTEVREEKISLCITTLLSMSILMLMVSDQMPSTSTFIPLISWFYMCAIVIISVGAIAASFVISIQKFGRLGKRMPMRMIKIVRFISRVAMVRIPAHLKPKSTLMNKRHFRYKFKDESRKSTIAQFAKYFFSAGTEMAAYPMGDYANNNEPLIQNGTVDNKASKIASPTTVTPAEHAQFRARAFSKVASEADGEDKIDFDAIEKEVREMEIKRELSKIEYDWLATVIERCTFLLFLLTFLAVAFGINIIGFVHWYNARPPLSATRNRDPLFVFGPPFVHGSGS